MVCLSWDVFSQRKILVDGERNFALEVVWVEWKFLLFVVVRIWSVTGIVSILGDMPMKLNFFGCGGEILILKIKTDVWLLCVSARRSFRL